MAAAEGARVSEDGYDDDQGFLQRKIGLKAAEKAAREELESLVLLKAKAIHSLEEHSLETVIAALEVGEIKRHVGTREDAEAHYHRQHAWQQKVQHVVAAGI